MLTFLAIFKYIDKYASSDLLLTCDDMPKGRLNRKDWPPSSEKVVVYELMLPVIGKTW